MAHFPVVGADIISIHALHEESDEYSGKHTAVNDISIHALHEESDAPACMLSGLDGEFQSTLSMRRATNPLENVIRLREISIHALHEESDVRLHHRRH